MKKTVSTMPFTGTKEQEKALKASIKKHEGDRSALMQVLQDAQEIYGYLPLEVQQMVAHGLDVSVEEVYGVATFYSQFSLTPKGKYKVSVCLGTACYVKNAQPILERISKLLDIKPDECTKDGKFSLEACRCIGACGLAPVITINDDVYGRLEENDVDEIIESYKLKND